MVSGTTFHYPLLVFTGSILADQAIQLAMYEFLLMATQTQPSAVSACKVQQWYDTMETDWWCIRKSTCMCILDYLYSAMAQVHIKTVAKTAAAHAVPVEVHPQCNLVIELWQLLKHCMADYFNRYFSCFRGLLNSCTCSALWWHLMELAAMWWSL